MDFISNQEAQNKEMLHTIGVTTVEELFRDIPQKLLRPRPSYDDGLSEFEGMQLMEKLAAKNRFSNFENYLGGGAYEHHVPAIVGTICSKSEFLTSYTPYQPEASQGMLQATFEFQSAICALTGLDAANASLYDGASACAEAMLMSLRHHKDRNKVLIAESLHPHYRAVVEEYLNSHSTIIEILPSLKDGRLDPTKIESLLDDKTAAILVQSPNFFGVVEELKPIFAKARSMGALNVICANPLAYGIFASAADVGADIAVGDCQPFGLPLQYGGPYVGYIACRENLLRQMPGRIVGETVDTKGRRGFVLTLQAREQHIRREKATSNICTNQALAALATLVSMLWYGKKGISKLALTNYQRTAYLKEKLGALPHVTMMSQAPCFNEFAVKFSKPIESVQQHFRKHGIEPGIDLGRYYSNLVGYLLVCVTETKNKEQLDRYVEISKTLLDTIDQEKK
jgi:glycine dehydrogenase subunit 1